ncbi:MAG: 1-acyl-sn-glycerol-3-phosphate acyltransferase [Spirochaetales bacterium]|nr:1-acyl-sn-glycerol-3-phosphate acyltransferase [Spirochaetales bacterium]
MNFITWILGLTKVEILPGDREVLKTLKSTVVVANHPSLLDVTILMALLPQADCIVNSALFEKPVIRHVVKRLFIPNSLDFSVMLSDCKQSLKDGNCLIIFPEGSRSVPGIAPVLKKGSSRIALDSGFPIQPVMLKADNMRGLRKGDSFYRINEKGRYVYEIILLEKIQPEDFIDFPLPVAARHMTKEIHSRLFV